MNSPNDSPKRLSYGVFPIRQSVLHISQAVITFHGIHPPIFVQSRLQQYRRRPFMNSAYCSLSNPTLFLNGARSMCNDSSTDRHKFSQIPMICHNERDFRSGLRRFCLAQIRLKPLSGEVPHVHHVASYHQVTTMCKAAYLLACQSVFCEYPL